MKQGVPYTVLPAPFQKMLCTSTIRKITANGTIPQIAYPYFLPVKRARTNRYTGTNHIPEYIHPDNLCPDFLRLS